MKVKGFDGRSHSFLPVGHMPDENDKRKKSTLHIRARKILRELYPTDRVLEEVSLPGSGGLISDFYLPNRKIMVECHGEQHYRFNAHFHRTRLNFLKSQSNDRRKKEWCDMNNISLIELPFDEDDDDWRARIRKG